jgi:hypothetical protein
MEFRLLQTRKPCTQLVYSTDMEAAQCPDRIRSCPGPITLP